MKGGREARVSVVMRESGCRTHKTRARVTVSGHRKRQNAFSLFRVDIRLPPFGQAVAFPLWGMQGQLEQT